MVNWLLTLSLPLTSVDTALVLMFDLTSSPQYQYDVTEAMRPLIKRGTALAILTNYGSSHDPSVNDDDDARVWNNRMA